jgi:hypothetical protein
MTMNVDSSSSSLGAQKQKNKTRQQQASTHHCFLCVHKNKTKKDDKCQVVVVFFGVQRNKTKKQQQTPTCHRLSMHKNKTTKTMMSTKVHRDELCHRFL